MRAKDVMSSYVITVGPDLDVGAAAAILVKNGISAVPVVGLEEGKLLGIVSEGDLMRRTEAGTERRQSWWLELLSSPQQRAQDFVKENARKVKDVMTRDVVTAAPDMPLREIANQLEKHNIKRVPIVENGRLIGIVSRANLIQALASHGEQTGSIETSDARLREAVVKNLRKQPGSCALVNVFAEFGVISLWGFVRSEEERSAIRVATELTPGVRAVNDNMRVEKFAGMSAS